MTSDNQNKILQLDGIHTYYGKSHIVQGISFEVTAHECVALLGRNGAGKTTTLRSIMGLTPPQEGKIVFKGDQIQGAQPYNTSRKGIAYVPEDRQIFNTLTVMENLSISAMKQQNSSSWTIQKVFEVFPSLLKRRHNRGNQLSGGEQQMLTVARALMSNPDLLLLDEPSEGLAPIIVENLIDIISSLKENGLTILIVEQNIRATRNIADHYCILQQGRIVYKGSNHDFWATPTLQEKYLGV